MGLKECASMASVYRGYDYYKEDRVSEFKKESETTFSAVVKGSNKAQYHIYIDIAHPRKSKCDCPHADGRRIVCKHQMAVFFKAFPQEAETYERELMAEDLYEEEWENEKDGALETYLDSLSKDELKSIIYDLLDMSPSWVSDRFFADNVIFDASGEADEAFCREECFEKTGRQEKQKRTSSNVAKPVNKYILTMRLCDTDIWRKMAITGNYSFADLHTVIQIVFGWENCHLHRFEVGKMIIGNYDDEEMDIDEYGQAFKFEDDVHLELILLNVKKFSYYYDFGDDWQVEIQVDDAMLVSTEEPPVILEFGGGMARENCGGAESIMQMRKRKTDSLALNNILKETFIL